MSVLPTVCREIDSPTNMYCLYCGRQLQFMPGPDDSEKFGDFLEPCQHVLFVALTDIDFVSMSDECRDSLRSKGYTVVDDAQGVHVTPPPPEGADPDDDEWLYDLDLTLDDMVDLVLEVIGPLHDGLVIQDCYPAIAGGGSLWVALKGTGRR